MERMEGKPIAHLKVNEGLKALRDAVDEFGPEHEYLLRGTYIHNKRHNLPLILGLNYAYIFPGVGTRSSSRRWTAACVLYIKK